MRSQYHALLIKITEWAIFSQRLGVEHVQCHPCDPVLVYGAANGVLINRLPTRRIDELRSFFHGQKRVFVDYLGGLGCDGHVHGHEIGLPKQGL
jgi:hypothetical protein